MLSALDLKLSLVRRALAEFVGTLLLVWVVIGTKLSNLHATHAERGESGLAEAVAAL